MSLIRSQAENDRINARVNAVFPELEVRKIAAYEIGKKHFWIYPLTSLKESERAALKAAGYEYYGRNWAYV